jgi:hypothetical protein
LTIDDFTCYSGYVHQLSERLSAAISNKLRIDRRIVMKAGKFLLAVTLSVCGAVSLQAQTIDEVYKRALAEGGTLNFYGTLAQINAEIILPAFEKRFPGIKVNHVDATADQLATRIIAESRGGRILADVFQTCWMVSCGSKAKDCFSIDPIRKRLPIRMNSKARRGSPPT